MPPINIDAENAVTISTILPYSNTQNDIYDAVTGLTYTVWYKFVANFTGVIGYRFYGELLGAGYRPTTTVFIGDDPDTFLQLGTSSANCNGQLPITTGGTYFFRINKVSGNPPDALLSIDFIRAAQADAVAGDIFIRPASVSAAQRTAGFTGLPAGWIDTANEEITGFIPYFIAGESGDILPTSGRMLFADEYSTYNPPPIGPYDYNVLLYENDFTLLDVITFEARQAPLIRTHDQTDKWYILNPGLGVNNITFRTVASDGTLGTLQTITAVGCTAFAVSADETILYLAGVSGSANSNIKRWDIVNEVFLSDLVATVTDYQVTDILALTDGSLIVCYHKTTVTRACIVKHITDAGVITNSWTQSYSTTITSVAPRLAYASDGDTHFWLLSHLTNGYGNIRKILVADGSIVVESDTADSTTETIEQLDPPLTMTSDSCPIIELRAGASPPVTTTLTVTKVVSPTSAVDFNFVITGPGGFSQAPVLNDGESVTYEDLTPGEYSVVEIPIPDGYSASYSVSNGHVNTAITIAEGDNITVTVTNTLQGAANPSGIYQLVEGSHHDELYISTTSLTTENVAIPEQIAVLAPFGG